MKYALLSVTDKSGLDSFGKTLIELGFTLLSTGGTLNYLKDCGLAVTPIDTYTGFPEMLDGRVKTLHPKVHGGILFKRDNEDHVAATEEHEITSIDLVCVNLYPFEEKLAEGAEEAVMIENIDIGGPSMIRSAAKNFQDVLVVTDPADYERVAAGLREGEIDLNFRKRLAQKAFSQTAYYDSLISRYFERLTGEETEHFTLGLKKVNALRYGENPHQEANLYQDPMTDSYLSEFEQLQGKELSFNNINDLALAVTLAGEFSDEEKIVSVGVKHATPCGVALGETTKEAYERCYEADSISIFGGIIATTGEVDGDTAREMIKIFLEVVAAPSFSEEAKQVFEEKPNVRLITLDFSKSAPVVDMKLSAGKVLMQGADVGAEEEYNVVTETSPSQEAKEDLRFAMKVAKHTRSNAIVIARDGQTLGIGGGNTSRIGALEMIFTHNPHKDFTDSALASDAFFPFDDCVNLAAEHGIISIIQPGGSMRDEDSIKACNEHEMAMVFTGKRHFKH